MQGPSAKVRHYQVGTIRITRVVEFSQVLPAPGLLLGATDMAVRKHAPWLAPHFIDDHARLLLNFQAFCIAHGDRRIIVDTCVGNDKQRPIPDFHERTGDFVERLTEAGFGPGDVDTVLCTHLHVDHVGWNTRRVNGRWVPTFPDARYLFSKRDLEHFESNTDFFGDGYGDSVKPVLEAGLADAVEMDHRIDASIWLEPTPGHSPGHVSVRLCSEGVQAVITGDLMHHPVQCAHPEWPMLVDVDREQARETRERFLASVAEQPVLVIGTHFAGPSAGYVRRSGTHHVFQSLED